AVFRRESPDAFGGVIAANVNAVEGGRFDAAIPITAGDRVAQFAAVGEHRRDVVLAGAAIPIRERFEAFKHVPAVIFPAANDRDFLDAVLSDVADPQVTRDAIEAEAPGLAETVRPDFRAHIAPTTKRIIGGDGVLEARVALVHIDANDLAEEQLHVLAVALRVLLRTGVAHA